MCSLPSPPDKSEEVGSSIRCNQSDTRTNQPLCGVLPCVKHDEPALERRVFFFCCPFVCLFVCNRNLEYLCTLPKRFFIKKKENRHSRGAYVYPCQERLTNRPGRIDFDPTNQPRETVTTGRHRSRSSRVERLREQATHRRRALANSSSRTGVKRGRRIWVSLDFRTQEEDPHADAGAGSPPFLTSVGASASLQLQLQCSSILAGRLPRQKDVGGRTPSIKYSSAVQCITTMPPCSPPVPGARARGPFGPPAQPASLPACLRKLHI